jgi:succinate-semialdehyde dehydrogenase/glutarate-semialdehyde dehydrogenase
VTFTGSVPVGKHLSAMAGAHMKPAIVELGGHAPVIMCDDIDPVSSAGTSAVAKSRNAGQVCVSPTRFFVADAIYDRFADAFAAKAETIKVGNGLDPDNQMGPLANERRLAAMETLVADAKAKGARVTSGGARIGNRGYYFPVTVLADVPDDARAASGIERSGVAHAPATPVLNFTPVKNRPMTARSTTIWFRSAQQSSGAFNNAAPGESASGSFSANATSNPSGCRVSG